MGITMRDINIYLLAILEKIFLLNFFIFTIYLKYIILIIFYLSIKITKKIYNSLSYPILER